MLEIFKISYYSLMNRKLISLLTVISIGMSIMLFIGIERIKNGARESFSKTVSKTDLIVGARGGSIQLLLFSIFHMGNPSNNISFKTYEKFKRHPEVAWTIPISLGDSYKGHKIIATHNDFFTYYQFQGNNKINVLEGKLLSNMNDIVIGYEMAKKQNLSVGQKLILSHGTGEGPSLHNHNDHPFFISGILQKTGTPIDRAAFITLAGMEQIHNEDSNQIRQISSFLLGTKNRISTLSLQHEISTFKDEPIMAIIPAVTLNELWNLIGYAEDALKIISFGVVVVGILGMIATLYSLLESRRREISILRAIGMGKISIYQLLIFEAFTLAFLSCVIGVLSCYLILFLLQGTIFNLFGILIPISNLNNHDYVYLIFVLCIASLVGALPAKKAYKNSLNDGLSLKL